MTLPSRKASVWILHWCVCLLSFVCFSKIHRVARISAFVTLSRQTLEGERLKLQNKVSCRHSNGINKNFCLNTTPCGEWWASLQPQGNWHQCCGSRSYTFLCHFHGNLGIVSYKKYIYHCTCTMEQFQTNINKIWQYHEKGKDITDH